MFICSGYVFQQLCVCVFWDQLQCVLVFAQALQEVKTSYGKSSAQSTKYCQNLGIRGELAVQEAGISVESRGSVMCDRDSSEMSFQFCCSPNNFVKRQIESFLFLRSGKGILGIKEVEAQWQIIYRLNSEGKYCSRLWKNECLQSLVNKVFLLTHYLFLSTSLMYRVRTWLGLEVMYHS